MSNKVLIVGDLHFKDRRGYADYIEDGRESEQAQVLSAIVEAANDCDRVVFLGDQLNSLNNSSSVINKFVNFIERFGNKRLFILLGNHDRKPGKVSALNFLSEITGKNWKLVIDDVYSEDGLTFCPHLYRSELGTNDNAEAAKAILDKLPDGDVLFAHHAISDINMASGVSTSLFDEPVLNKQALSKKFKVTFAGHIHSSHFKYPQDNVIMTGSIFNDECGEHGKFVYKLDTSDFSVEQILLPGRGIYKLENPIEKDFVDLPQKSILKVVLTQRLSAEEMEALKKRLRSFETFILLEQYPTERRKIELKEGQNILTMETEELLNIYAKQNKLDPSLLLSGWKLINTYE